MTDIFIMTAISSISELLTLSGSQYRIYDIGRKIDAISKEQFNKIELNQQPYPYPSQGHAFVAIAFWQKLNAQPFLWFIKLALDERGLLNQGTRNHFIAIIIEALGSNLTINPSEQQEKLLKKNPYHFTPSQYKLAALHSIISYELKQKTSEHFESFKNYLSGIQGWDNWLNIGIQGITDFAVRLTEADEILLINALNFLPEEVLVPLCSALENETLSVPIITAILKRFKSSMHNDSKLVKLYLLRSIATNARNSHVIKFIDELLQNKLISTDIFIVLAGRCWIVFEDQQRITTFLELMVEYEEQAVFNAIFKDLIAIPSIRPILLQAMRSTSRSKALSNAIGQLFQSI